MLYSCTPSGPFYKPLRLFAHNSMSFDHLLNIIFSKISFSELIYETYIFILKKKILKILILSMWSEHLDLCVKSQSDLYIGPEGVLCWSRRPM